MAIISKTYGKLLAILLSSLGFSAIPVSCAKYGCPSGEIQPKITGSIVSEKDMSPIQGIRAVLKDNYQGYDTAYTAKNGGFSLQYPYTMCKGEAENYCVELCDVDGETNGAFENKNIPIVDKSNQDLGTIQMSPKE